MNIIYELATSYRKLAALRPGCQFCRWLIDREHSNGIFNDTLFSVREPDTPNDQHAAWMSDCDRTKKRQDEEQ